MWIRPCRRKRLPIQRTPKRSIPSASRKKMERSPAKKNKRLHKRFACGTVKSFQPTQESTDIFGRRLRHRVSFEEFPHEFVGVDISICISDDGFGKILPAVRPGVPSAVQFIENHVGARLAL